MSRRLTRPFFPVPPQQYMQNYFAELVRSFSVYLEQMQNPGDIRGTTLTLTDLQTDNVGLETGALFQSGGFVKITLGNSPSLRGSSGTGQVGQVSVVIS
tara:strand:- start:55 stop:351 length:297 start_codon:yes stop_codon:yes gene_type:complete